MELGRAGPMTGSWPNVLPDCLKGVGVWPAQLLYCDGGVPARQPRRHAVQLARPRGLVCCQRNRNGGSRGRTSPPTRGSGTKRSGTNTGSIEAIQRDCKGVYLGIRGQQAERADVYAPDRYDASQQFGEAIRRAGEAGIIYDSLRRRGGTNIVAHRPYECSRCHAG